MDTQKILSQLGAHEKTDRHSQAIYALIALKNEIGEPTWLKRAIMSVEASRDCPEGLDDYGRPFKKDGSVHTFKSLGLG